MAVVRQSKQIAQKQPPVTPSGAQDATVIFGDFDLAGVALAANNVIEMVELPPGMVPVDVLLDTTDLDTNGAPTISLDVGVMAGDVGSTVFASRTTGAQFIAGSTIGRTGGLARADVIGASRLAPTETSRSIGVRVAAAPATGATTGTVRLSVLIRPSVISA